MNQEKDIWVERVLNSMDNHTTPSIDPKVSRRIEQQLFDLKDNVRTFIPWTSVAAAAAIVLAANMYMFTMINDSSSLGIAQTNGTTNSEIVLVSNYNIYD